MQFHLKALLGNRPTSKHYGCWQNPFLCAVLERALTPLCWLEAVFRSLPRGPLQCGNLLHQNDQAKKARESLLARWILQLFITLPWSDTPSLLLCSVHQKRVTKLRPNSKERVFIQGQCWCSQRLPLTDHIYVTIIIKCPSLYIYM